MTEIIEVWADTGLTVKRNRTVEEQEQYEKDKATLIQLEKDKIDKEAADTLARNDAITHAKSLGFTDAMIAVMYPNLGQ